METELGETPLVAAAGKKLLRLSVMHKAPVDLNIPILERQRRRVAPHQANGYRLACPELRHVNTAEAGTA